MTKKKKNRDLFTKVVIGNHSQYNLHVTVVTSAQGQTVVQGIGSSPGVRVVLEI